jgi:hypothetical protein
MNTLFRLAVVVAASVISTSHLRAEVVADAPTLSGEAAGLAQAARLLIDSTEPLKQRAIAVVTNVTEAPAPEVPERKWRNDYTGIEMVDRPSKVSLTLELSAIGKSGEPPNQTVIKWTSDFASNSKYGGHVYRDFREVVKARPLVVASLICFVPPLQSKDGGLTDAINVLPSGSLEALAKAISWRAANADLFQLHSNDKVIEALRAELVSANPYQRLTVMLQLVKLAKLGADDVGVVLNASSTPVEIAAATMLVITDASDLVGSIGDALVDPAASRHLLDGVAIGAATHFLSQPNSERLWGAAKSFQIVRGSAPNLPDTLKATISFPLLLKLADVVAPKDSSRTLEVSSLLFKLLKASSALRR